MGHYNLGHDVGKIVVVGFDAQPRIGGAKFVAECEMNWFKGAVARRPQIVITGGVLKVKGPGLGNRDLGWALPYSPSVLEISERQPQPRFALEFECSRAFLRELNELRRAEKLTVSVLATGWALLAPNDSSGEEPLDEVVVTLPTATQDESPGVGQDVQTATKRLYSFQAPSADFEVEPSRWANCLKQCGFMRTMILEVPLPERTDASGLGGVVAALEAAVALHQKDDVPSKQAVASLREVFDELVRWRRSLRVTDGQAKQYVAAYRGTTKDVRLRHLLWSMKRLVDLAHHRARKGKSDWTRHDAEFVITTLAALIRHYVEELPLKTVVP